MRHDEAIAKFKDEEMLPPGLVYSIYKDLVDWTYHEYLDTDMRAQVIQDLIIPAAASMRLILPNEAAYFQTHLDEGLETIRERFWESLK